MRDGRYQNRAAQDVTWMTAMLQRHLRITDASHNMKMQGHLSPALQMCKFQL